MCDKCNYLVVRSDIVQVDRHSIKAGKDWWLECIRSQDHEGPHLIQRHTGEYVAWEYDEECDCQDCLSEDLNDHCILYGVVSDKEANLLIESSTRGSPHKDVVDDYLLPQHQSDWSEEDIEE